MKFRHDPTSPAWPVAGVALALIFVLASAYLYVDVRTLRGELEASVGAARQLGELDGEVEALRDSMKARTRAEAGDAIPTPYDTARDAVAQALARLDARTPPPADPDGLLPKLHVRFERIQAAQAAHAAADARYVAEPTDENEQRRVDALHDFFSHADAMIVGAEDLISAQQGVSARISMQLARRWNLTHALLLLSCLVAGLSARLLYRLQHQARRERDTEQRLRDAERHLGTIVANAPVVVWAVDGDGTITLFEGAALASIDLLPGELVGRSVFEHDSEHQEVVDAHRRVLSGETVDYRLELDGVVFQCLLIPIRGKDGAVIGASGVGNDVTAREQAMREARQAEAQRAEMQKAEALARVAGGVAHEFSNLLTVVTGFASLLRSNPDLSDRDVDDVRQILKASGRAAELTQQLLAFSRRQRSEPRIVDLNAVVEDARKMLETLLGVHVDVRVLKSSGPLAARLDPGQFQQVLLNLGLNARDAMPDGGSFTLALTEVDRAAIAGDVMLAEGRYACLSVSDSGQGMDEETRKRVFEPFFTTKGPKRGTGLGLPTVQGILRQAGGDVALESAPGEGTTFRLFLPRCDPASIDVDTETKDLRLTTGREAILLVEDEAMVRAFTSRVLRRAGYEVIEAADGNEALDLTRSFERRIALLVSDIVMPGIGGRELARLFLELRPGTPVLFLSGYAHEDEKLEYLQKPFSPQDLTRLVRARIDADDVTRSHRGA